MASIFDNLSDEDKASLANFVDKDQMDERLQKIPEGGMPIGMPSKFSDTGREASGVGEQLDSMVGAPVRQGIHQVLTSDSPWDAVKQTVGQFGKDPRTAPTGHDIAAQDIGIPDSSLGKLSVGDVLQGASYIPGIAGSLSSAARTALPSSIQDKNIQPSAADIAGFGIDTVAQLPMGVEAKGAAAGVENIAKKLGVTVEEARNIMDHAAQRIPGDVFEENMRALKDVKGAITTPEKYAKLGAGADFKALQSPSGKVVKVPHMMSDINPDLQAAPALVEHAGLGPKTKNIRLDDRLYQVQDKVTPLDAISRRASRQGGDPALEKLYRMRDQLDNSNAMEVRSKVQDLDNQIEQRQEELYKMQGIDPTELRYETGRAGIDPRDAFEQVIKQNADQKLGNVIEPIDLHEGNIGLDKNRNPTIFDTSRFRDLRPENLTPEMKQKIMESNIMTPEKKQFLQEALNGESKNYSQYGNEDTSPIKYVAGKAGVPGEMSDSQKALASAIAKLQKAQAAGETVGRQTGVDINSFKDLQRALGNKMPMSNPSAPPVPIQDDAFIEKHMNNLLEKLKKEHGGK